MKFVWIDVVLTVCFTFRFFVLRTSHLNCAYTYIRVKFIDVDRFFVREANLLSNCSLSHADE